MRIARLLLLTLPLYSFDRSLVIGTLGLKGILIYYETRLAPSAPPPKGLGSGSYADGNGFHQYLYDSESGCYFGYDLTVQSSGDQYLVSFKPLSLTTDQLHLPFGFAWKKLPLAGYPAPQRVTSSDTIAIELMRNPTTGQTITDYLRVSATGLSNVVAPSTAPSDFRVEDVSLRIMEPRLRIDGELLPDTANYGGGVTGPVGYFYVPNRGRLLLSIAPHEREGFVLGGEVHGNQMTLKAGGATYVLTCGSAIVEGGGVYNLYIFHQPNWQPHDPNERGTFLLGAADRATYLVH